jgi:signal transduction histidine kinase/DNA-binding response OmpR family regulator/CHASE3 domain sensor protein
MRARSLLILVFGLSLIGVCVRSFWSFRAFNRLLSSFGAVLDKDERTESALNEVAVVAVDLETGVRGWLLTWMPAFREPYDRQARRVSGALDELAAVERGDDEGLQVVDSLRTTLRDWDRDVAKPLLSVASSQLSPARLLALNVDGKRRMDAIRADLSTLRKLLGRRRKEHLETVATFRGDIVWDGWTLAVGLAFVLLLGGLVFSRQLVRPLARLVAHIEQRSEGEPTPLVLRQGVQEVRVLAGALSAMASRLAAERSREQAFARLVAALAEGGSVDKLAELALRSLVEQGAAAGILWVARDSRSALEVAASIRVDLTTLPAGGSPLVKETFRTERTVEIDNAGPEGLAVLEAAGVETTPRSLLVAIICAADTPVGVIELVCGARFDPEALEASLRRIGLTLQNAMAAERTATLQGQIAAAYDEAQSQNEELQAQQEELLAQGAELVAQRAELEQRNDALAETSRLKSEFLSSMSHELRTPLNAIIGFSDLLRKGTFGELDGGQADAVADIRAAGRQLLSLVNDILDLSKIEAGRLEVEIRPVDLDAKIAQALALMAPLAEPKRLRLVNRAEGGKYACSGDGDRVRQVLVNLLSNAVKFTPEGGSITVSVASAAAGVRVEVADTGIGISTADQARLFEPFVQLGARRPGGTGLGLSISKRLLELMGGRIGVTSELGRGSTFYFTLPPVGAREETALAAPDRRASGAPELPAATRGAGGAWQGRDVLVVDDDVLAARATEVVLGREGYRVTIAATAEMALALVNGIEFTLVIVALGLPGASGFSLVHQIRTGGRPKEVPIVVFTAHALTAAEERDLGTQVQFVAQKGVTTGGGLLDVIADLCGRERRKRRVLVIDDNEMNRRLMRALLTPAGYEVIDAPGSKAGIEMAFAFGPDVILMDIRMPEMDGIEATRALQLDPRTKAIPIVALSAQAMSGDREQALAAGCLAYITKPVAEQELLGALADAVARTATVIG